MVSLAAFGGDAGGYFCIDRFEAPNLEGAMPFSGKTAYEGEKWCAQRGKRLCTDAEWTAACEGKSKLPLPYGRAYHRGVCNDDKEWKLPDWKLIASYPNPAGQAEIARLYQADASGSRRGCISEDGVYDMIGNVREWVTVSSPHPKGYKHVMKGCYWSGCYRDIQPTCQGANRGHPGEFRSYEAGFRCCLSQASAPI